MSSNRDVDEDRDTSSLQFIIYFDDGGAVVCWNQHSAVESSEALKAARAMPGITYSGQRLKPLYCIHRCRTQLQRIKKPLSRSWYSSADQQTWQQKSNQVNQLGQPGQTSRKLRRFSSNRKGARRCVSFSLHKAKESNLCSQNMMRACHRPTIAADDIIEKHSCVRRAQNPPVLQRRPEQLGIVSGGDDRFIDTLHHPSGWSFSSHHSTILNEAEHVKLSEAIKLNFVTRYPSLQSQGQDWIKGDSMEVNNSKLHIPPMIFGKDILQVRVGSSAIAVNASDAILCWAAQHAAEEVAVHPLKVVKVPFAAKWTARLREGVEGADAAVGAAGATSGTTKADSSTPVAPQQLSADWTFSSDYVCTLLCSDEQDGGACLSNRGVVVRARELPSTEGGAWDRAAGDSFRAIGMLGTSSENGHKEGAADTSAGTWRIESAADSGVDYTMLRRQDEPILFYDECVLYQDDLEDCGEVSFEAKIRVMPSCWFLLTKLYLRVDGALTRCREVRLFHRFNPSSPTSVEGASAPAGLKGHEGEVAVHMEVCWRELAAAPSPATAHSCSPGPGAALGTATGTASPLTRSPADLSSASASLSARLPPPASTASSWRPPSAAGPASQEALLMSAQGRNMTHLLPLVNDREGICQYFTLFAKAV